MNLKTCWKLCSVDHGRCGCFFSIKVLQEIRRQPRVSMCVHKSTKSHPLATHDFFLIFVPCANQIILIAHERRENAHVKIENVSRVYGKWFSRYSKSIKANNLV